jgi:hypothetical protein
MISSYLTHIHIASQTFTISNLSGGFTSGLIRSCITCITSTGKALLNEPTSHGRNIRHIFFQSKVLCSCRQRSIVQYNMHNQYSGLFIFIMNYLHVVCMILMVLSCVLCMILMMFIYVYYGLFICTNLVYIISLFLRVFSSHLPIFGKKSLGFWQKSSGNRHADFRKNCRFIDEISRILIFLISTIPPSSPVRFS